MLNPRTDGHMLESEWSLNFLLLAILNVSALQIKMPKSYETITKNMRSNGFCLNLRFLQSAAGI
jgi:hypothetical protein